MGGVRIGLPEWDHAPVRCADPLAAVVAVWGEGTDDWAAGLARAACVVAGATEGGVVEGGAAVTGPPDEREAAALLSARLAQGRPCAVWDGAGGIRYAAATIAGRADDFVWVRRMEAGFSWQEVLALRHLAIVAAPMLALDRRRVEADLLVAEQRHRCGNDLQLVSSLLNFHARQAAGDEIRGVLRGVADRVATLAHARREPTGDLSAALRGFRDALAAQAEPRRIVIDLTIEGGGPGAPDVSDGCTALVLMAVNEVVTNALKHAFADEAGGTVRIALTVADGRIHVEVDDDGSPIGGDAWAARGGTGIDLVRRLLGGRRGSLTLPPPGSKCFIIDLPAR